METRVILLLGVKTENNRPTDEMKLRCDGAVQCLKQHPGSFIIACGCKNEDSAQSEASIMKQLLIEANVPEGVIILEESSRITRENITCALPIIDQITSAPVLLVTSDYHMPRALMTLRRCGGYGEGRPVNIPFSFAKFKTMLLEIPFMVDLMLGYQDEGAKRPAWTRFIMRLLHQERP